ncbi:MAG: hypothetical protein A3J55_03510 [Candidatus Ryanbacteria bacterium RIFCSPHIGHO2_02_FULL_45_17b]|uniref:Uncharacterized protein n=1 Tax=Candidatus Ryanbacteria bacterium RIFCSPHIGHO2_01_FULL_45_22 TaxID=1802114 RepID=A0A1G2G2J3_9BACT|nr:MAG: hypothetical protein A2719_04710 [Candidatus Ryanbacteria bacterium RIFCSPHIGHO2_01_FULL_45_22]OGZ47527.1 MAG: hypothetical protein A3J55_03510 [Candidatus Ryanbacteria bacterium RIFCSPHIGHO2_02_FULL_45_17b]
MKVNGSRSYIESREEFTLFLRNPERVHFVGMSNPWYLGVQECFVKLEHTHFSPGTSKNNEFYLRLLVWMQAIWTVVSVPSAMFPIVEGISDECGLQIVKGVPTAIVNNEAECLFLPPFPDTVFTLLYKPDNPVYTSDAATREKLVLAERQAVDRMISCQGQKK